METVQVHSKAFVIRWVNCQPGSSVTYKVIPEKKSVCFGVYQFDQSQLQPLDDAGQDSDVPLADRLKASGGHVLGEIVRIKGNESSNGELKPEKSVVAFVFDNSFSKNTSKRISFSFDVVEPEGSKSIQPTLASQSPGSKPQSGAANGGGGLTLSSDRRYLSGILLKHKRKKLQGYARRYFSLDTTRGLLNYYLDNRTRSLRGVMPVKICEIDVSTFPQIIIDSGVEKWDLKALNKQEFDTWVSALQGTRSQQYSRMLSREPSLQAFDISDTDVSASDLREIGAALASAKHAVGDYVNSGEMSQKGSTLVGKLGQSFHDIESILLRHSSYELGIPRASLPPPLVAEIEEPEDEEDDIYYDAEDVDESDLSSVDSDSEESGEEEEPQREASVPPSTLAPLPHEPVKRRTNVPVCEHQPPSLLAILRKSKDISNTSVPVTSNEPISVLQKLAENLEYSELLDQAAEAKSSEERVLLVATFVVASMSSFRQKDRAMRKPFNPMLGEVYELVREDKGFRFLAEKVSHRPPIFATFAESKLWNMTFTSRPYQKIWGKSAEITDTGTVSIVFSETNETVEYTIPDCFLRNLLAGEKYVEPVGTFSVTSSEGPTATGEFKAGGMFSGRSEEVKITCAGTTYEGKWTEQISNGGKPVWKAGSLVSQPKEHYGWPVFTATLNEITEIEKGLISPVDSRLRPDQTAYEKQDVDTAENFKQQLELRQRERRKEYEENGKSHDPIFFNQGHNVNGSFLPKSGKQNYWVRRENQDWEGIIPVLDPSV